MGKPSERRKSARRPGRAERARVKNKHSRCGFWGYVAGAGTVKVNAGRKKYERAMRWVLRMAMQPISGEQPTPKAKEPGQTASL
ncbi:MAG: hypothetical protein CVU44_11175 [Chloroflexi bacterium HGW-Chloroflexi-6]|nr:MAG: hypothetical protein CVU44_11175 [Chloroflexi bacterium HGW-Chloroflexi-6]